MAKPQPWFRFYTETTADAKLKRAAAITGLERVIVLGVWTAVLSLAKQSDADGRIQFSDDMPLTIEEIADEAGTRPEVINSLFPVFQRLNMLALENETWIVAHWNDRQYKSDNATKRWQDWKAEKEKEKHSNVGANNPSNVGSTLAPTHQIREESDKNRADTEARNNDFSPAGDDEAIGSPLSDEFTKITGILPHDNEKWVEADQIMTRAGITPDELKIALEKMDADALSYSGLWSVTKTALWVHSRRQAGKPIFTTPPKKNSMYGDGTGLLNGV